MKGGQAGLNGSKDTYKLLINKILTLAVIGELKFRWQRIILLILLHSLYGLATSKLLT